MAAMTSPAAAATPVAPDLDVRPGRAGAIAWGAARGISIVLLLALWEIVARSGIMPAFGSQLSEEDRWNIINFLRAQFVEEPATK